MRRLASVVVVLAGLLTVAAPAAARSSSYPDVIALPDGFFPEGIAVGTGHEVYAGSLANGAIWKGDLRSGAGDVLVPGTEGGIAVGLSFDDRSGNLFVADGPTGTATVYDGTTGATVAALNLAAGFINDVIVTRTAAYFTNSFAPELYVVPLDAQGDVDGPVRTVPLSGDFVFVPGGFNANGIEATPDGRTLIVAGSSAAELYTIRPPATPRSSTSMWPSPATVWCCSGGPCTSTRTGSTGSPSSSCRRTSRRAPWSTT